MRRFVAAGLPIRKSPPTGLLGSFSRRLIPPGRTVRCASRCYASRVQSPSGLV